MKPLLPFFAICALLIGVSLCAQDGSTTITLYNRINSPITLYVNGDVGCGPVTTYLGFCEDAVNPGHYRFEARVPGYPDPQVWETDMQQGEKVKWTICYTDDTDDSCKTH